MQQGPEGPQWGDWNRNFSLEGPRSCGQLHRPVASGSEGSVWLGNGGWSKGGLSEDCWGPRATSPAGLGFPGMQGRRATISVLGGFWRGEGAWKLLGPQGQPSRSGGWCAGGWGEGQAGYCQELRATSPGSGPSLSARGRPGAGVVGPPDSGPSLFLSASAPLIRAPAGMQGPSRESRVISP